MDTTPTPPGEIALGDDDVIETFEVLEEEPTRERISGFDGIGTRREARERALSLLYEAEQRGLTPFAAVIDDLPVAPDRYAADLVVGTSDHLAEIDDMLARFSTSWPLDRMPALDRALLRLGAFELLWTDVPTGAVISEAVELAKRYSTDDSHRFVNGMLARIARERVEPVGERPGGTPED